MTHKSTLRRAAAGPHASPGGRPGRRVVLALTVAGLTAAALGARGVAAYADGTVQVSHAAGYPRSSDTPPVAPEQAPGGYGEENPNGESYDTNLFFDAKTGDSDVVLMRVQGASIDGYGEVEDADPDSATCRHGEAWGEDRLDFSVPAETEGSSLIRVVNRMRIAASYDLAGTGHNTATLVGQAIDILDQIHEWRRTFVVGASVTTTTTSSTGESASFDDNTTVGADKTGVGGSTTEANHEEASSSSSTTTTSTSGQTIAGDVDIKWVVLRDYPGPTCSVRIASTELIEIQAQALAGGAETHVKVPQFQVVNLVDASYITEPPTPPEGGGPGTPGGEDGTGPTTGGDGTGPKTGEGGTAPKPGDGGTEPVTPGGDPDDAPQAPMPGDPPPPPEGPTPPPSGGTETPPATGGESGGTSGTDGGTGAGAAPAGGGTDVGGATGGATGDTSGGGTAPPEGGTAPGSDGGGTVPPPIDGSRPGESLGGDGGQGGTVGG